MGAAQSTDGAGNASSPEELSHLLAERFATKCFTPLELTHFKDNFFSRALDQGGFRYWNEKILSDFLGIPDGVYTDEEKGAGTGHSGSALDAGPVIFRMVSYLGAFPFQSTLAPSVLTFEAMVKVAVLLTERYGKVLKRGRKDRIKLLFGSLADVARRDIEKKEDSTGESAPSSSSQAIVDRPASHAPGFAIDEPAHDDEDEDDDDDLVLAALESLDAIEVFKHDHRIDRAVYEARISVDTFRRLLMLLLVIAPLKPLESVSKYTFHLSQDQLAAIRREADSIVAGFSPEEIASGIRYRSFARTVSFSLPHLFDPLTPLFEHLLFSKNLDLSRKRAEAEPEDESWDDALSSPPVVVLPGSFESAILNPSMISHLSFFLPTSAGVNLFQSGMCLHPVFSTTAHGESLTSFSHNVLTWQAPTLLLVQGAATSGGKSESDEQLITLGAYLPQPWKPSSSAALSANVNTNDRSKLPCLFQLHPYHSVLEGNPFSSSSSATHKPPPTTPVVSFSTTTGIAIGCEVAPPRVSRNSFGPGVPMLSSSSHSSKQQEKPPMPIGAGSLIIDAGLETAQLHVSYTATTTTTRGAFLPPVPPTLPRTTQIDIYDLEIWGLVEDDSRKDKDAISLQRAHWAFESREAERRKNVNLRIGGGGTDSDVQSARALLEMAGIVGDRGKGGGSV